jgi:hypothetical protein
MTNQPPLAPREQAIVDEILALGTGPWRFSELHATAAEYAAEVEAGRQHNLFARDKGAEARAMEESKRRAAEERLRAKERSFV